jgi:hypothetical protein
MHKARRLSIAIVGMSGTRAADHRIDDELLINFGEREMSLNVARKLIQSPLMHDDMKAR